MPPPVERHPTRPGKRLTVFVGRRDRVGHRPVLFEILKRVRHAELAGVTVLRGQVGFGAGGRLHHTHLLSEDSTQAIVVVDAPERIDAFVAEVGALIGDVLVVVDDVEIVET